MPFRKLTNAEILYHLEQIETDEEEETDIEEEIEYPTDNISVVNRLDIQGGV